MLLCILILLALCGSAHGTCGRICGLRPMVNTLSSSRVVGGTDVAAGFGAWAGIASIHCFWSPYGSVQVCGGTLINTKWLLTAAHCFINITNPLSEWAIVLGTTTLIQEAGSEREVRRIKKLIVHPKFEVERPYFYDVALVELDQPVRCRPTIQVACLPSPGLKVSKKNCYVAGWGDRIVKSAEINILQQAKVQYVDRELCNSSDWLDGLVHDYDVCAGHGGVSTCQGDSGGPLVCQDSLGGYYWQIGVTSWAIGCARPKRPTVFMSTQYFYNWIWTTMGVKPVTPSTSSPAPTSTSTPLPTVAPKPTQACPFPREKLVQFFNVLKDILKYLKGIIF